MVAQVGDEHPGGQGRLQDGLACFEGNGLAVDETGGLTVAHAGFGCVWMFDKLGEPLYRIKSCAGHATTNIAFGGADRKTLYITESSSGQILIAKVPVAGSVLYSHI